MATAANTHVTSDGPVPAYTDAKLVNNIEIDQEKQSGHDGSEPKDDIRDDLSTEGKQDGVKRVEAITTVWSKELLLVMFILLYLVSFVDALLQSIQSNLIAYVTSSFSQHGLLATTSIVATILGGVCNLTIAKIIDIWGRVEGFIFMVVLIIIGMVMKAAVKNVEMYAAAHTIYWVGHIGVGYIINIMLADMTTLRNRAILFGINTTPLIATTFAGPKIAELFYVHVNFNWAFGAFLIILVAFCIPVALIFIYSKRKAVRMGVYPERVHTRSFWQSTKYYFIQFDVPGMFFTVFGWGLLLLPFSLAGYAHDGWKTGYIIAMIVLGVLLLVAFVIWEKFFAPVSYFPFEYLKDRTILGACLVYGFMFISIFCWDAYYYSYLQVVHRQSITNAGYILNSFSLMSSFIAPLVGILIRYTGDFKWTSVATIPFSILGTALLVYFRHPSTGVGYLVMCQLFNGIATGVWALCGQLGIMASVGHQEIAVSLAMFGLFGSIGAAIGNAIAGGLWNNILPDQLYKRLPAESKDQAAAIFGDIVLQMSYPDGSPERDAIVGAYGDVQRKMVIAGSVFILPCIVAIFMWKNINVKNIDKEKSQTKGNVW